MALVTLPQSVFAEEVWNNEPYNPDDYSSNVVVFIGGAFPFSGGWPVGGLVQPSIDLALEEINKNEDVLPGVTAVGVWGDTKCLPSHGLSKFVSMVKDNGIQALIGCGCSVACEPIASLGGAWQIPQISWGCTSPILSDKALFPYFLRTAFHELGKIGFFIALFKHFGWKRCATITVDIPLTSTFMDRLSIRMKEEGIEVVLSEVHKINEVPRLQMERIKERAVSSYIGSMRKQKNI